MKKIMYTSLLAVFVLLSQITYAAIIRVDNNPGASADYVKLQDAINNANAGDTIYIVGSPNYYDLNSNGSPVEIRINKKLTLIGPGYFLGENENTQAKNQTVKIYQMNIGEGADGTVITGLDFDHDNYYGEVTINQERFDGSAGSSGPSNLKIYRNAIEHLHLVHATNALISQNYFNTNGYPITIYENANNTVIQNNIILSNGNNATIYGSSNAQLVNTVISNNTFNNGFYAVDGATIQNNIFITGTLSNNCDDNNVKNNLFTTTEDAVIGETTGNTLANNIFSAVQANIFVVPTPSVDNQFQLADDSPAASKGINGENLGAYGGPAPYVLSGLPPVPAIYELNTSGVGNASTGLKVEIKVRSHQ